MAVAYFEYMRQILLKIFIKDKYIVIFLKFACSPDTWTKNTYSKKGNTLTNVASLLLPGNLQQ